MACLQWGKGQYPEIWPASKLRDRRGQRADSEILSSWPSLCSESRLANYSQPVTKTDTMKRED
jgi:hypothetical protein